MTEPLTFTFADDGAIPNSKLPLLVYRQAVPADPAAIERLFTANRWPAAWRDAVHPYHHFHSDAHEAFAGRYALRHLRHDRAGRRFERRGDELMAVEALTFDGEEDGARLHLAGVDDDGGRLELGMLEDLAASHRGELGEGQRGHETSRSAGYRVSGIGALHLVDEG